MTAHVKLTKKGHATGSLTKAKKGDPPLSTFEFQDNQDDTCTVFGVDSAGNQVDISAVASLTPAPTSSDPTVVSVDPPAGMTFTMHGLKVGHADITAVATWTDGSTGPFTFLLPVDTKSGGPTGIIIVPGTPTVRP